MIKRQNSFNYVSKLPPSVTPRLIFGVYFYVIFQFTIVSKVILVD